MNGISRRGLVRIISFTLALITLLGAGCFVYSRRARSAELKLEASYLRAVENLNDYMTSISNTLIKGKYANTAPMLESLADKLKNDTQGAKESLSELPLGQLHLENTYRFLSQLGEYTLSLSRKLSRGESLTEEEAANMEKMEQYCASLREEVQLLEDSVQTGTTSFKSIVQDLSGNSLGENGTPNFTDGFKEYEEGFAEFPSLIYDGPFSDHLTQQKPKMTEGKESVTVIEARKTAAKMTGMTEDQLKNTGEEAGNMPCYTFSNDEVTASVTKQGALPVYYLNSRMVEEGDLPQEDCVKAAREYLDKLAIGSLTESYYESYGNIMTINFAALQDDVTLYPDLIKVSVAMDNGEILGFDARGYLTNHHQRTFEKPALSMEEAQKKVSPNLTVKNGKMAVVPSTSLTEKLCYEFVCTGADNENILVYINAHTGMEEEILILLISENGTLTF